MNIKKCRYDCIVCGNTSSVVTEDVDGRKLTGLEYCPTCMKYTIHNVSYEEKYGN